jgi:hypothetical protein
MTPDVRELLRLLSTTARHPAPEWMDELSAKAKAALDAPFSAIEAQLLAQVDAARSLILHACDLMTTEQVGQWAGVREWLERDTETYPPSHVGDHPDIKESLDFERLRSGARRALYADHQPIFDAYYAALDAVPANVEETHDANKAVDAAYALLGAVAKTDKWFGQPTPPPSTAAPYATCRNGGECLTTEQCDDHPSKCIKDHSSMTPLVDGNSRELADLIERSLAGQRAVPEAWAKSVPLHKPQWDLICQLLRGDPLSAIAPTIQCRPAVESSIKFLLERYEQAKCDSDGVSNCVRCQVVFLAKSVREYFAAKDGGAHG